MSYIQKEASHDTIFNYMGLTVKCVTYALPTGAGYIGYIIVEDETAGYFKTEYKDQQTRHVAVSYALRVAGNIVARMEE